jgi:hypothetical protein
LAGLRDAVRRAPVADEEDQAVSGPVLGTQAQADRLQYGRSGFRAYAARHRREQQETRAAMDVFARKLPAFARELEDFERLDRIQSRRKLGLSPSLAPPIGRRSKR